MSTLDDWAAELSTELGIDLPVDIKLLLDLARDAAHGVDRPAAPITTFLMGYAAATAGGGPEAVSAAAERTSRLIQAWVSRTAADPE